MSGKSGSVALFLRNLPPNTSRKDLKSLFQKELHKAGVRGTPLFLGMFSLCTNCSILRITDLSTGTTEYHGLVEVRPASIAMQAIQVLSGKDLQGSPLEVRRYRNRSPWGEHRNRSDAFRDGPLVASTRTEWRRPDLKIDLIDATPKAEEYSGVPVATA